MICNLYVERELIRVTYWSRPLKRESKHNHTENKWMREKNESEDDGVTWHGSEQQQAMGLRQQRLVTTEPALICSAFILSHTQHCFGCSSLFLSPFGFPLACCLATWSPPTPKHRHHVTQLWLTWSLHHEPSACHTCSHVALTSHKWCKIIFTTCNTHRN